MRAVQSSRRRSFFLLVSLAAALPFLLAACGANGSGSTSTGSVPSPVPTSTFTGRVSPNGCPSNAVVGTAPAPATLVLKPSDSRSTINAHLGDVIEIQLPFGQAWSGPTSSQGMLQLQPPAGYAWNTAKACVWRFLVQSTGTTQLNFFGKAICKKGEMCPQYIMSLPFTISAK